MQNIPNTSSNTTPAREMNNKTWVFAMSQMPRQHWGNGQTVYVDKMDRFVYFVSGYSCEQCLWIFHKSGDHAHLMFYFSRIICKLCKFFYVHLRVPLVDILNYLRQGGYVFSSVCLSVTNITQKVTNGLWWNFMDGFGVVKGTHYKIFGGDLDHDPALMEICAVLWKRFSSGILRLKLKGHSG